MKAQGLDESLGQSGAVVFSGGEGDSLGDPGDCTYQSGSTVTEDAQTQRDLPSGCTARLRPQGSVLGAQGPRRA